MLNENLSRNQTKTNFGIKSLPLYISSLTLYFEVLYFPHCEECYCPPHSLLLQFARLNHHTGDLKAHCYPPHYLV